MSLCDVAGHSRALALYDVAEDFGGELFALVVADDTDLYLLLIAEVLVVVHLAGDEGIGAGLDGLVEQEVARTATECHTADRALEQLVGHGARHAERLLHLGDKGLGSQGFCQLSYDAAATGHAVDRLGSHEQYVGEPQLLGHLEVDATLGVVHVRMHGDHGHVVLHGFPHGALHVGQVADGLQSTEQQGMVADNEIAALLQCLVDHRLSDVQTQ